MMPKKIQQVRQNLAKINQDIIMARKKGEQQYQQKNQVKQQVEEKKGFEKKKKGLYCKVDKIPAGEQEAQCKEQGGEVI